MRTMAADIPELATALGYEKFRLVEEDWGAAAYQVAAQYPERVRHLVYQEMTLPGYGFEDRSFLTRENLGAGAWLWHINFYNVPDIPELLITGREREYFSYLIKQQTRNPRAIAPDALDEYIRCYSSPGGLRCMAGIHRATLESADQNYEAAKTRLKMPVLAVGGRDFIGEDNERQMREVAEDVRGVIFPWGASSPKNARTNWLKRTSISSANRIHAPRLILGLHRHSPVSDDGRLLSSVPSERR